MDKSITDSGKIIDQFHVFFTPVCKALHPVSHLQKAVTPMKGLVFTELLEMADKTAGEETVDRVLDRCPLSNNGAFIAVGNYPFCEFAAIVGELSSETKIPVDDLQIAFGHWMLDHFVRTSPDFFNAKPNTFDLLESVDSEIHVEVRKLYPDAELPKFLAERPSPTEMVLTYRSPRGLVPFCKGLIEACIKHYGEEITICQEVSTEGNMTIAAFRLQLESEPA